MDIRDFIPQRLDFFDAVDLLAPVSLYVLGMAIYAIFIFHFYRFVATRDMFKLNLSKYRGHKNKWVRSFLHVLIYVLQYLVLFPFVAFFWFAVLTTMLAFLSRGRSFPEILLMSLATVAAIRVTAYYKEDLSKDLAKILPFGVLAIVLINAQLFTVTESLDVLGSSGDHVEEILYYLVFLIGLEFVLRLLMGIVVGLLALKRRLFGRRGADKADPAPAVEPAEEIPQAAE